MGANDLLSRSREMMRRLNEAKPDTPIADAINRSGEMLPKAYVATSNESGGQITAEWCDSSGVGNGRSETLEVLP